MGKNFKFSLVSYNWALFYIAECSRKEKCMRYQGCKAAPDEMTKILVCNPRMAFNS